MRRATGILAPILVIGLSFGCGKGAEAPANPPPVSTTSQSPAPPAQAAVDDAGSPPAAQAATAASPSPSPAPSATAEAQPEAAEPDKCAPTALAYEKSLRAKMRKCWHDAAKKAPNERIIGSIRLVLEIDSMGKIVSRRIAEKSDLPEPIQQCMMKAFKAEPLVTKDCEMKTFTIAEKFPR